MTFPAATGIMTPEDFNLVHRIYIDIAAEPWFTQSSERRELFALSVIDTFRQGNTESHALARLCREIALREFGNGLSHH